MYRKRRIMNNKKFLYFSGIALTAVFILWSAIVPVCAQDYIVAIVEVSPEENLAEQLGVYVQQQDISALRKMLDNKEVNVNALGPDGWNALMVAASEGFDGIVEILLRDYDAKPDITQNLNHEFTFFDDSEDINYTALMLACMNEYPKVVEVLLRYNADINTVKSKLGRTALDIARETGNSEILDMLEKKLATK